MLLLHFLLLCCWHGIFVYALSVTENSSCKKVCEGAQTKSTDVVCNDADYNNTSQGQKMRDCLNCETNSTSFENLTDNDIYWFLCDLPQFPLNTGNEILAALAIDNMKVTTQNCIFAHPFGSALPACNNTCWPLKKALRVDWLNDNGTGTRAGQYEYCSANKGGFVQYAGGCADCLQQISGLAILGNFLSTMQSACSDKPNATENQTVSLRQALFATSTDPTSTASISGTPGSLDDTGSSTGAKAGIGVGAGFAGLALLSGIAWLYFKHRRNRSKKSDTLMSVYPPEDKSDSATCPTELSEVSGQNSTRKPDPLMSPVEIDSHQIQELRELPT